MIELCAFADEAASGLKEQISALKENGIKYLELRSIDGKNVLSFTDAEIKKYSEELKKAGVVDRFARRKNRYKRYRRRFFKRRIPRRSDSERLRRKAYKNFQFFQRL